MKGVLFVARTVASLGGIGYLPFAPGTWGSLCTWLLCQYIPVALFPWPILILMVCGLPLATWAIACGSDQHVHDPSWIVIDEFFGMALVCALVPSTLFVQVIGFCLFRLFDIAKPGPIGWVQRHCLSAWGVLADDLCAGMCAIACIWFFMYLGFL